MHQIIALRIEKGLRKVAGVEDARVNFALRLPTSGLITPVKPEDLFDKVGSLGYKTSEHSEANADKTEDKHKAELRKLKTRFIISAVLSIPLLYTMVSHFSILSFYRYPLSSLHPWIQFLLATPVQFWISFLFYNSAYRKKKNKSRLIWMC